MGKSIDSSSSSSKKAPSSGVKAVISKDHSKKEDRARKGDDKKSKVEKHTKKKEETEDDDDDSIVLNLGSSKGGHNLRHHEEDDHKESSSKKSKRSREEDADEKKSKKKEDKEDKKSSSKAARNSKEESSVKDKKKSSKKSEDDEEKEGDDVSSSDEAADEETNFGDFPLSEKRIEYLRASNYKTLFPIQAASFPHIFAGEDMIGKARTGTGKTVAFLLPTIERLEKAGLKKKRGHKILVVTPTRELAKQIGVEVSKIAPDWTYACIYGGTDYGPQVRALREGVDIIVGCPGRLNDHIEKGTAKLGSMECVILDEADKMLDMGFSEPTEQILESVRKQLEAAGRKTSELQALLFSATLPTWVKDMINKFLKPNHKTIDLVGSSRDQTSTGVTHMSISCFWSQRPAVLADLVRCYAGFRGRTIVFTDTKREANELAVDPAIKADCGVLHGDIAQTQREITLDSFRDGKLRCLIATDVAARGIDIPEVDLVILTHPPKDPDTYVHRSGRTGRAGRKGVCIVMYQMKEKSMIDYIERRAGIQFQKIGPPQPTDIIRSAAHDSARATAAVEAKSLEYFRDTAQDLIDQKGAVDAVAACLAVLSGYEKPPQNRSLLTSDQGLTTMVFRVLHGDSIRAASFVWAQLRRVLPEDICNTVKCVKMLQDYTGAAIDVGDEHVQAVLDADYGSRFSMEVAKEMPKIAEGAGSGGFGGGYGAGGNGGGYGAGGNGRSSFQSRGRGDYGGGNNNNGRSNGPGRGRSGAPSNGASAPIQGDCRVFVGGLPMGDAAELDEELRATMGPHGSITDVYIPIDRASGKSKGIAFVTYSNPGDASKAAARGGSAKGKPLRCALAGARPGK